jgi:hypothetical protein
MIAYTEKTGWVEVVHDDVDHFCMRLAVPGYTFYLASYQEILEIREEV